ncbi:hypothetical protein YC2023_088774 [Brassica napus]
MVLKNLVPSPVYIVAPSLKVAELCHMLEIEQNMTGWRKIRLALIIIVDGVIIAHKQEAHPTLQYVRMVEHLSTFFAFPWGRELFLKTISCMKPPKFVKNKCEDPVATLICKLRRDSFSVQGFLLSLQFVAFPAIPELLSYISASFDQLTLMDLEDGHLPYNPLINSVDIHHVEFSPDVSQ